MRPCPAYGTRSVCGTYPAVCCRSAGPTRRSCLVYDTNKNINKNTFVCDPNINIKIISTITSLSLAKNQIIVCALGKHRRQSGRSNSPIGTGFEIVDTFHHVLGRPLADIAACVQNHQAHLGAVNCTIDASNRMMILFWGVESVCCARMCTSNWRRGASVCTRVHGLFSDVDCGGDKSPNAEI